jgi:transcriptional regulator with XRE-family HTH domain
MALKRIKAQPRTAEEIAEEQRVRDLFGDRPSVKTLIERGEIDPDRIMTGTAEESLLKALSALKRARQTCGQSLSEIARRSGIDLSSLSRLETGKNPNPTFETLSRYADALGLRVELSLVDIEVSPSIATVDSFAAKSPFPTATAVPDLFRRKEPREEAMDELIAQYPAIIGQMGPLFDSHTFILALAHNNQDAYVAALNNHVGNGASFKALHAQLSRALYDFPALVKHAGVVNTPNIFGVPCQCAQWQRI